MSAGILELPEVRDRVSRVSVSDYERMAELGMVERRTELIRGFIIKKISSSPLLASISTRLFKKVIALLPPGYTARQEQPLRFVDSAPEPDLAVVMGDDRDYAECHPSTAHLVVEVAISSVALDRANAALYAENGVQEYWIILPKQLAVEVYRLPKGGEYREKVLLSGDETIVCAGLPGISLRVGELLA